MPAQPLPFFMDQTSDTTTVQSTTPFDLTEMYKQHLSQQMAAGKALNSFNIGQPKRPEYQSRVQQRIAMPLIGTLGYLEMVTGTNEDTVEFCLQVSGRASIPFKIHRKDLEALVGELTLAKLSK